VKCIAASLLHSALSAYSLLQATRAPGLVRACYGSSCSCPQLLALALLASSHVRCQLCCRVSLTTSKRCVGATDQSLLGRLSRTLLLPLLCAGARRGSASRPSRCSQLLEDRRRGPPAAARRRPRITILAHPQVRRNVSSCPFQLRAIRPCSLSHSASFYRLCAFHPPFLAVRASNSLEICCTPSPEARLAAAHTSWLATLRTGMRTTMKSKTSLRPR
jgi:hypothetical protein